MSEQEKYKLMLEKIINETEKERIQTSEELIRTLVDELTNNIGVERRDQIMK